MVKFRLISKLNNQKGTSSPTVVWDNVRHMYHAIDKRSKNTENEV